MLLVSKALMVKSSNMAKTLLGIFPNRPTADRTVAVLIEYGYRNDEISIISKDSDEFAYEHPAPPSGSRSANNIILGVLVGAIFGALVGFAVSYVPGFQSSSLLSDIGLAGSMGVVLVGAIIGAVLGGLIGFAVQPRRTIEKSSYYYDSRALPGQVIVAMPVSNSEEQGVRDILNRNGAENIRTIDMTSYEDRDFSQEYTHARGLAGLKGGKRDVDRDLDRDDYF